MSVIHWLGHTQEGKLPHSPGVDVPVREFSQQLCVQTPIYFEYTFRQEPKV